MGTKFLGTKIADAFLGKTCQAILSLLFPNAQTSFYIRQIARETGSGLGATQRELKKLSRAGIITRTVHGRQVYYQANKECPIFNELRSIVVKTAGMAGVLSEALSPLAERIIVAFIYGSIARGGDRRTSDVDILVVGSVTFADVVSAIGPAQAILNREVNPTVYLAGEFKRKLGENDHFVKTVLNEEKIFFVGGERELARLVEKRLAD